MPFLDIDDRKVWCGTAGTDSRDGRPLLLFVHGAGSDHSVWALQARALAGDGWNVATPDLPGHGRSEDAPELTSIAAYAKWLARLCDSLEADRLGLIGHSMGACIALDFAAANPDRVQRLALLGSGEALPVNPGLLDDTLNDSERAHRFITAFGHSRAAHFGAAEVPGIWLLGSTLALLNRCEPAVLHRDFAASNDWNGSEIGARIKAPTLIVSGSADRMTPPRTGRALSEAVSGSIFELIAESGHMLMAEAPGRVTGVLRGFFARPNRGGEGRNEV